MGLFDSLFGKKLLKPRPDDVKMWKAGPACERCNCLAPPAANQPFSNLLHTEFQDTNCEGWKRLEELIQKAAAKGSTEFSPGMEMPPELWKQVMTLPASIGTLRSVKRLYLYGSNLVRVPPEIGLMENLEELDIYTSYRLHWLPYEVTHCKKLARSRASTRALYGNYKYRPPFPQLGDGFLKSDFASGTCSICGKSYPRQSTHQVWISLLVATDVFPLLVNSCSEECLGKLPQPAQGYFNRPHTGGLEVQQPPPGHMAHGKIVSKEELIAMLGKKN